MDYPDEVYNLHQTPIELCKKLIQYVPTVEGDICFEPFAGQNNFFNQFPSNTSNIRTDQRDGLDYTSYQGKISWVISNPPFCINTGDKRINAFVFLLEYFMKITDKGIAFLGNNQALASLTPKRLAKYNLSGWYINKIVICNIKKWFGRYYFIIFEKKINKFIEQIEYSY